MQIVCQGKMEGQLIGREKKKERKKIKNVPGLNPLLYCLEQSKVTTMPLHPNKFCNYFWYDQNVMLFCAQLLLIIKLGI